jgi:hypothetical protein
MTNVEQSRAEQLLTSAASSIEMDIESMKLQCTWTPLSQNECASRLMKSAKIEILFVEQKKEVHVINQKGILAICPPYSDMAMDKDLRFNVIALAATIAGSMIGSILPSQALDIFAANKGVRMYGSAPA